MVDLKKDFIDEMQKIDQEIIALSSQTIEKLIPPEEKLKEGCTLASIEKQKKDTIQKVLDLVKTHAIDDKEEIMNQIRMLLDINEKIDGIIKKENNRINIQRNLFDIKIRLDKKIGIREENEIKLQEELLDYANTLKDKANDILTNIEDENIKAQEIKKLSQTLKEFDAQKLKNVYVIQEKFEELHKIIKEQNDDCSVMISVLKGGFLGKFEKIIHGKDALHSNMGKISDLYSKEIMINNEIFRKAYKNAYTLDSTDKIRQISWLEKKKIELNKELELYIKQLNIPKVRFQTGDYVAYSCSLREASEIIKNNQIKEKSNLIPYTISIRIGSEDVKVNAINYKINDITRNNPNQNCEVAFIFPKEDILKDSYFLGDPDSMVVKLEKPEQTEKIISSAQNILEYFDFVLKDCDELFDEWLEDAKKLDVNFQVKWDNDAKEIITRDFARRWIRDASSYEKNRDVYEFLLESDHIEDLLDLDKKKFMEKIVESKRKYQKYLESVKGFFLSKDGQDLGHVIFVAPKSSILYWEKFFLDNKIRPDTFYYDGGSIDSGVKQALDNCMINENKKQTKVIKTQIHAMPKKIFVKTMV